MPTVNLKGMVFDARPDRVDLRDRKYMPILSSLPAQCPSEQGMREYATKYVKDDMILDQGKEGACTGFGLGAVINFLGWRRALESGTPVLPKVSPRMLYHLARFYDEWSGEDYEGSSCRGAMKGWHRHGVCTEKLWPYRDKNGKVKFIEPGDGWDSDAAFRPLGAYYRINKDSIADLQAAIFEVGAIYVSAKVHEGWFEEEWDTESELAIIRSPESSETGGHAFAIVGYNAHGFIIQNSWGKKWGTNGFAILTYPDWVEKGMDAWVAVLGAPMIGKKSRRYFTPVSMETAEPAQIFGLFEKKEVPYKYENKEVRPWNHEEAYSHSIVMGNNGVVLNRSVTREHALTFLEKITYSNPMDWLEKERPKLVFYAHGGLNSEETSIDRVRILGPYFKANGVYPIFFSWKTGFLESFSNIVGDKIHGIEPQGFWREIWDSAKNAAKEAKDRAIEEVCQRVFVKAIWSQMKQNAEAAATLPQPIRQSGSPSGRFTDPTLKLTIAAIKKLKKKIPNLEVHIIGHSAGSILLGHMLSSFQKEKVSVASCTLFAPACTVDFALKYYKPAIESGVLKKSKTTFEILKDEYEKEDSVGPYGKSLLYLVSRALETHHKTPILGMANAWDPEQRSVWNSGLQKIADKWQKFWGEDHPPIEHSKDHAQLRNGKGTIPLAHGSFDNDVTVMTKTISRILDGRKLRYPIENLRGY